jgi:hypothetical protein
LTLFNSYFVLNKFLIIANGRVNNSYIHDSVVINVYKNTDNIKISFLPTD